MSELNIYNDALIEIGADVVSATTDRPDDLERIYSTKLDQTLAEFPWQFAKKRTRITAAGLLDCSAKVITFADADPDTIADDGSEFLDKGFLAGDIAAVSGSGSNDFDYGVKTAVAGTLTLETAETVVAEVLTNDSDLKIYARPASRWSYKYAKPSGLITPLAINEINMMNQKEWADEGAYLVTNMIDSNDQIDLLYIEQVTDTAKWNPWFRRILVLNLAQGLAVTIKESISIKEYRNKLLDKRKLDAFAAMTGIGTEDETPGDSEWLTAGR